MGQLDTEKVSSHLRTRFLGRPLLYFRTASSTQDVARERAEAGAPEGTAVFADEQTAGRGRLRRQWVSPPGENIYVTLLLRPTPDGLRSLAIVAPLAILRALEKELSVAAQIKWPNDVIIGDKKVAGVLIESKLTGDDVDYALVGIGLNVNMDAASFPGIADTATSLRAEKGHNVPRETLLAALLNEFEDFYLQAKEGQPPYRDWRAGLQTLGKQVQIKLGDRIEAGLAEDTDVVGNLIIRRDDGSLVTIEAGDVTLLS